MNLGQRIKHVLQRPWVNLLTFAILGASIAHVANLDRYQGSWCSRFIQVHIHHYRKVPPTILAPRPHSSYAVYRTVDGLNICNRDFPSPLDPDNRAGKWVCGWVSIPEHVTTHGFWAVTRIVRSQENPSWMAMSPERFQPPQLTPEECAGVESIIQARRRAHNPYYQLDHADEIRIIWSGYAFNLLTLTTLAAFVISLGWIPRHIRLHEAALRIAQGICPRCHYNLAGLPAFACPECGWRQAVGQSDPSLP